MEGATTLLPGRDRNACIARTIYIYIYIRHAGGGGAATGRRGRRAGVCSSEGASSKNGDPLFGRRTLLPGRDRDARFTPMMRVMRRAEEVLLLQRWSIEEERGILVI